MHRLSDECSVSALGGASNVVSVAVPSNLLPTGIRGSCHIEAFTQTSDCVVPDLI